MYAARKTTFHLALLSVLLLILSSCGQPGQSPEAPAADSSFNQLIGTENLSLEDISITMGDTQGRILRMVVSNPEMEEVVVTLPCGFYFVAEDDRLQRMMVIQPDSVTIPAGGSEVLEPYVICIDSDLSAPEADGVYTVGSMASGELLQFAQCLCELDLEESDLWEKMPEGGDPTSMQFAVWAVSDDIFSEGAVESLDEGAGALNSLLGDEMGEEMAELVTAMLEMYRQSVGPWLDTCGISIEL